MHWEFFLSVEEDLLQVFRYVEPNEDNFDCYSLELARLFLSLCSEVDVVAKQICTQLDPGSTARNIGEYRNEITKSYNQIAPFKVQLKRFGLTLEPWQNWKNDKSPYWWGDHNDVKHHRHREFKKASLTNVLNAAGGLFILLLYYYRDRAMNSELAPNSRLFTVEDTHTGGGIVVDDIIIKSYLNLD